jgi:hypothetical protein
MTVRKRKRMMKLRVLENMVVPRHCYSVKYSLTQIAKTTENKNIAGGYDIDLPVEATKMRPSSLLQSI